jgi:hypothetical protein
MSLLIIKHAYAEATFPHSYFWRSHQPVDLTDPLSVSNKQRQEFAGHDTGKCIAITQEIDILADV